MIELTRADVVWLLKFIDNYRYLVKEYPELFNEEEIDDAKVVKQFLKEKMQG